MSALNDLQRKALMAELDGLRRFCYSLTGSPADTDDLLQLISDWGAQGGDSDIDNDGIVGTDDLLALIGAWGPC